MIHTRPTLGRKTRDTFVGILQAHRTKMLPPFYAYSRSSSNSNLIAVDAKSVSLVFQYSFQSTQRLTGWERCEFARIGRHVLTKSVWFIDKLQTTLVPGHSP